MIHVRILGPDDLAVFNRVAAGVFDNPIDPRWMAEFLADPRHHMAVALVAGEVVGMASAVHYVHPDKARGKASAENCFKRCSPVDASSAAKRPGCGTEHRNIAARRMYAAVGGVEHAMVYVMFELEPPGIDAV